MRRPSLEELMAKADTQARAARGRNLVAIAVLLLLVGYTWNRTEVDPVLLITKSHYILRVLGGFSHPDTRAFLDPILPKTLETLYIAILGTTVGAVIAVPLSFLAARNLMRQTKAGTVVYFVVRLLMSVTRSTPSLVWAIIWVIIVGIGPFPGVLAITTFSIGLISKLFSEVIEAIDWGQVEALTATGAGPLQVVRHGVVPQVVPYMIANVLYCFEVNVHSSTVLGIVGAGGLGLILQQYIGLFLYPDLAMWLIVVIVFTSAIDYASGMIRRRII
jgi:phosphonate transport system permease protein